MPSYSEKQLPQFDQANLTELSFNQLDDESFARIKHLLEQGKQPSLIISKTDLNQGRLYATQTNVDLTKVKEILGGDTERILPISVVIRKKSSKKHPGRYIYDIIMGNGHHRVAHALLQGVTVTAKINQVWDVSAGEPQPALITTIVPFNSVYREFGQLLK